MEAVKLLAFAALLGGIAAGSYEFGYVAGACDAAIGRGEVDESRTDVSGVKPATLTAEREH